MNTQADRVSKADVRAVVKSMARLYSSANIKSGEYRMSIPILSNRGRRELTESEQRAVTNKSNRIKHALEAMFPTLRGHVALHYHTGSYYYLSLRIPNVLLK